MPTRTTTFATNDVLTANDLNALAGAWNAYTPTVSGFTKGNGTTGGAYLRLGKLVAFWASFTLGSSSAAGSGLSLSLPVTANTMRLAVGEMYDISAGIYQPIVRLGSSTTVRLWAVNTDGMYAMYADTSSTVPFTWATGDMVTASGLYEAA